MSVRLCHASTAPSLFVPLCGPPQLFVFFFFFVCLPVRFLSSQHSSKHSDKMRRAVRSPGPERSIREKTTLRSGCFCSVKHPSVQQQTVGRRGAALERLQEVPFFSRRINKSRSNRSCTCLFLYFRGQLCFPTRTCTHNAPGKRVNMVFFSARAIGSGIMLHKYLMLSLLTLLSCAGRVQH